LKSPVASKSPTVAKILETPKKPEEKPQKEDEFKRPATIKELDDFAHKTVGGMSAKEERMLNKYSKQLSQFQNTVTQPKPEENKKTPPQSSEYGDDFDEFGDATVKAGSKAFNFG
jgi:hypothetical protein